MSDAGSGSGRGPVVTSDDDSALGTAKAVDLPVAAEHVDQYGLRSTRTSGVRSTGTGLDDLPPVDAVPDDVIDPGRMKLVLSRMFERHRRAPLRIGRLRVLDQIGEGGMGMVYAAYDEQLDRKVAVKVLRSGADPGGDMGRARLLREAQAMARLTHPNVATIYEVGEIDDGIYLSMEFIQGTSLDRWLTDGEDRGWREIVAVLCEAGRGLAAAHRAGIVHRDFKPHNVMIGPEGVVKVLDFGLAQTREGGELAASATSGDGEGSTGDASAGLRSLTQTGAILGTPAYMAPEQYAAQPTTEKSDQFSFCVALYEGLYGQLPFPSDSLHVLSSAVLAGRRRPTPADASVPPWIRRAILRGLSAPPDQRHPSMDVLLAELSRDPAATRRRVAVTLVVVGAVGAGGFALARALAETPVVATCDGARAELARTWTSPRRAAIEAALTGAGPAGAEAWARVGPRLDAYAERWITMRDEACRTHLEARQSDALFDRRTACLDQRRAGFDALTELLAEADAAVVDKAAAAAAELRSIAPCADTVALMAAVAPPTDPQVATAVREQRARLARARKHEDLGQFPAGLSLAAGAIATARELRYGPLEAEGLLRQGSLLMEGGSPRDAEATLSSAFLRAVAADHPEIAVEALSKRMFMRAEWLREVERALDDRGLADALFEQVPHARSSYGVYLNNLGLVLSRAKEYDEAASTFDRALEIERESFGPDHPQVAMTLANVGLFRFHVGDLVAAQRHLQRALDVAEESLGPSHHLALTMTVYLADVSIELGQRAAARIRLEQVRARQPPGAARARDTALALGRLELRERRYDRVHEHFEQALRVAEASGGGYLTIEPRHGLGLALIGLGRVEEGLRHQQQAHAQTLATMSEDGRATVNSYLLLARGHARAGLDLAALAYLRDAYELYEPDSARDDVTATAVLAPLARQLVRSGEASQARTLATRGLSLLDAVGVRDGPRVAELSSIRAQAHRALGDHHRAVADLREAERQLARVCEPDAFELAEVRFALARALRAASPSPSAEARRLARLALVALSAKGAPFEREARRVESWLTP
ncbi:MAG: serine/threonine-protein kinase [Myxococcota bacterium]